MRSLVVQTSFIGDVVLTTPLLTRLAADGPVDIVTTPAGAALLHSHPAVARVLPYDKHARPGAGALLQAARLARGGSRAYLAQGSVRSGTLALLAGAPERVGFDTSDARWLYTVRVTYRDDWHHARRLLSLADPQLAAAEPALRPTLYPTAESEAAADALVAQLSRPLVALAPGSAWGTKRWPGYAALAARLAERFDIAVVGSADDAPRAAEILAAAGGRGVDACGKLSLLGSAALIRRAAALVTNDSAPQHLASAMGTPTVAVFGPTVPTFGFGPLAPRSIVVGESTLACRPCDRHGPQRCPLGHWRCMRDVTPDAVLDATLAAIG